MQKLFENWRNFRKENLNEKNCDDHWSPGCPGEPPRSFSPRPGVVIDDPGERCRTKECREMETVARQMTSMADFSGILSWPDWLAALENLKKDPSLANTGWFALATLSIIPAVGIIAGPGKAARIAKLADEAAAMAKAARAEGAMAEVSAAGAKIHGAGKSVKIEKAAAVSKTAAAEAVIMPMRALDEAFESGVIGFDKFQIWFKRVKPDASRAEVAEAFNEIKGIVKSARKTDTGPVEDYIKADHQFFKVMKKYNVEIDPSMKFGGWTESLASAAPKIWNKYLKKYGLKPGAKIPTAAVGLAVTAGAVRAGGKKAGQKFFHALFHEIGHVELLKRFPTLAKPFLKEYHVLIRKRMEELVKKHNLQPGGVLHTGKGKKIVPEGGNMKEAEDLYGLWRSWGETNAWDGGAGLGEWIKLLKKEHFLPLDKASKRKIIAALQYKILKETEKAIRAAEATGDMSKIMMSGTKGTLYGAFQDVGHISQGLGMKQHKFYFLNFEEVAAELFEKTVRKRMGQHRIPMNARPNLRSERFPETVKILQKIVDEEIGKLIKESMNSYHSSIRKLNILIG